VSYFWLAFGIIWLGLGIDRVFFHPIDPVTDYFSIVLGVLFIGRFAWMRWRHRGPHVPGGETHP
jgi:hypothetical protein